MAKKILVVDDSKVIRAMVAMSLKGEPGVVAELAESGAEALTLVAKSLPDLVITDLNMPEMDGIALVRALRAAPQFGPRPIMMLTTPGDEAVRKAALEAGVTRFLDKPFQRDQIIAVVRELLSP